ncbi:MAG TPA: hypothetical protein VFX98_07855 [Longimicrobiaceae bacterium]|nr:hypothetical protein [Longimicrobiaceae bacterium]
MSELMQWNEDALIRRMTEDGRKPEGDCQHTSVRFLAGSGITDGTALWTMDVAAAVCEQVGLVRAVSLVATTTFDPRQRIVPEPSYATVGYIVSGGFVTLHVRTWDCRCEPRPKTPFDYHVAIAYDFVDKQ